LNEDDAMDIHQVGLMTPGDMGQAVAMQITARGFPVCTALDGRSERSHALARDAGLTDLGTVTRLIATARSTKARRRCGSKC
jgi:hypothetical protein